MDLAGTIQYLWKTLCTLKLQKARLHQRESHKVTCLCVRNLYKLTYWSFTFECRNINIGLIRTWVTVFRVRVMSFIVKGELEMCSVACLPSAKIWVSQKFRSKSTSPLCMFQMPHGISDNTRCMYLGKSNELLVNTDSRIWRINCLSEDRIQSLTSV